MLAPCLITLSELSPFLLSLLQLALVELSIVEALCSEVSWEQCFWALNWCVRDRWLRRESSGKRGKLKLDALSFL
jgi:hypothetical protein